MVQDSGNTRGSWKPRDTDLSGAGSQEGPDDSRHSAAVWAEQTWEVLRGGEIVLGVMFGENCCAAWMDSKFILFYFNNPPFSSRGRTATITLIVTPCLLSGNTSLGLWISSVKSSPLLGTMAYVGNPRYLEG